MAHLPWFNVNAARSWKQNLFYLIDLFLVFPLFSLLKARAFPQVHSFFCLAFYFKLHWGCLFFFLEWYFFSSEEIETFKYSLLLWTWTSNESKTACMKTGLPPGPVLDRMKKAYRITKQSARQWSVIITMKHANFFWGKGTMFWCVSGFCLRL